MSRIQRETQNSNTLIYITFTHSHHGCQSIYYIVRPIYRNLHKCISVNVVYSHQDGLLNSVIGSKMPTSKVLLQRSEEVKMTWCVVRDVWWMFQYLPFEMLHQLKRNLIRMQSDVVVQQHAIFR